MAETEKAIDLVVRFSRRIAEARSLGQIWTELVEVVGRAIEVDGVAAIEIASGGRGRLMASRNLPVGTWEGECEEIGARLGHELMETWGGKVGSSRTIPLVSGGDLIGVLVLFAEGGGFDDAARMALCEGLADVAAIALGSMHGHSDLIRSHADLRASNDALSRTEKLRSLGQMAAGISHDLKGILNGLSLPIQLLKREIDPRDRDLYDLILGMERTVARGVDTVERLRHFSRQAPEVNTVPVDIAPLLREAIELTRSRVLSAKYAIQIEHEEVTLPKVLVSPSELVTAVMNLIVNAVDAFLAPGTIRVEATSEARVVLVRVADNGPGMPPEIQERAFEPFFTTKGAAGTGLGLAMVYATAKRHAGTVELTSSPGRGTAITLRFPITLDQA